MAKSEQQRQKKLARKKSKELAKRKQLAAEKNAMCSLSGQIASALQHPIDKCYVHGNLFESNTGSGIGTILLSRRIKDGRVVFACFLVDRDGLGVKDAFVRLINLSEFSEHIQRLSRDSVVQPCDPARAKKLVTAAVDWAAGFGLEPMGDYHRAEAIWSDVDETQCKESFEFGDNGKPVLIPGPHDSPEFLQSVMAKIAQHRGDQQTERQLTDAS
ncbi:hypothetical protein NHH03_23025 [Stieleria sp. TO1_6]|uniref:hypothetical protein n=1 Tax=Stieleria tagensis TaxID=2956795 RepID=UPI00209B2514|nr:hypothetical protein [Stieleria tagensis]MCO8124630.1 hypothetical protein [Stieleria tagensis]